MKKQSVWSLGLAVLFSLTACEPKKYREANLNDEIPDFAYLAKHWERYGSTKYVGIQNQLLAWHPYGSSYEALKKRIESGGGHIVGDPKGEKWRCNPRDGTVECEGAYDRHAFFC